MTLLEILIALAPHIYTQLILIGAAVFFVAITGFGAFEDENGRHMPEILYTTGFFFTAFSVINLSMALFGGEAPNCMTQLIKACFS